MFNRSDETFRNRASSPLYLRSLVLEEDNTISFMRKRSQRMNQCWLLGFSILELAKLRMYELFYDHIQPAFGVDKVDVLLSDTDSFVLDIAGETDLSAQEKIRNIMDFSNMPDDHPLKDDSRKRVPGFLKNELPRDVIYESAAVKSKSYYLKIHPGDCGPGCTCKRTAKGVKVSLHDKLTVDDYKACIFSIRTHSVMQTSIQSKDHVNMIVRGTKVAFNSLDDKRYQSCTIHSYPYNSALIEAEDHYDGTCYYCGRDFMRFGTPLHLLDGPPDLGLDSDSTIPGASGGEESSCGEDEIIFEPGVLVQVLPKVYRPRPEQLENAFADN